MTPPTRSVREILTRRVLPPLALLLLGCAVLIAFRDRGVWPAIGFALLGIAGVLAVSLAFYEIGLSEDRARAREEAERRRRG